MTADLASQRALAAAHTTSYRLRVEARTAAREAVERLIALAVIPWYVASLAGFLWFALPMLAVTA